MTFPFDPLDGPLDCASGQEACPHYISAMAEERGWPTGKHQRTVKNARCILDEHPDPEPYLTLFNSVMSLHINFYEELFDDRQVQAYPMH